MNLTFLSREQDTMSQTISLISEPAFDRQQPNNEHNQLCFFQKEMEVIPLDKSVHQSKKLVSSWR